MFSLLADVTITSEALVVVGAILSPLIVAIGMLWRVMLSWRDDQIADLRKQRDAMSKVLMDHELMHEVPPKYRHDGESHV